MILPAAVEQKNFSYRVYLEYDITNRNNKESLFQYKMTLEQMAC
jgi:hypothetical protein